MDERDFTQGLPVISPRNMLPVRVVGREQATQDTVTIAIALPGTNQSPAPYLPGQFVTLALPTPRDTLYRSYSLCGDGDYERPWEITVKKQQMGAVSTFFYNSVQVGTLLYASLPRGTFTLPARVQSDHRYVFVAVGSGITPIFGMLRALAKLPPAQRPLAQLHYASRSLDDIIYRTELDAIDPDERWLQQFHYLSSEKARMTVDAILYQSGSAPHRLHFYYCGPDSLKEDLIVALRSEDVPDEQIHTEVFATRQSGQGRPAYSLAGLPNVSQGGVLQIAQTGATIAVQPQETILTALERNGYHPEFSCRSGACGACKLRVLSGNVDPVGEVLTPAERTAGFVLSCIAHPLGEVTLATGGRPPAGAAIVDPNAASGIGGVPGNSRIMVRLGALAAVGVLVLAAWNLTDHKPLSWGTPAEAAPNTTSSSPTNTTPNTPLPPTATLRPKSTSIPAATATLAPGQIPPPTPTRAPTPPTATPAPTNTPAPTSTPKPRATSTPSK